MRFPIKTIITWLLILTGVQIQAQITTLGFKLSTEANANKYKLPGKQFYPIYVPNGSEFMNDEWQTGYVVLENGDRYDSLHLKLNTYRNELIWLHSRSSSLIELDKDAIFEFGFYPETEHQMPFRKLKMGKVPKGTYFFKMLHDGKLKLVIWYQTTENQVPTYKDKYGYLRNTSFVMKSNYFLVFPGDDFERFRLKRASFLNLFGEKKKEIRKILRQNKNRLIEEDDFINAVKQIEQEFY